MAWQDLFTSAFGLVSLGVILFTVGMAVGFACYFNRRMHADEARSKR
jgi:hypothetical protein